MFVIKWQSRERYADRATPPASVCLDVYGEPLRLPEQDAKRQAESLNRQRPLVRHWAVEEVTS